MIHSPEVAILLRQKLTWDETPSSAIVLQEKNGCLSAQERGKTKTPSQVGLDAHEVVWTAKGVQRNRQAGHSNAHNVVRVEWFPRITHHIGYDLRNPKRVKEQENVAKHVMKLVHNQYATQQETVETGIEN